MSDTPDTAYWPPEDPRWPVLIAGLKPVPPGWCPGGDGCTCCSPGCDCGCRDNCQVWIAAEAAEEE